MMTTKDREAYVEALAYHTNMSSFFWQLLYGNRASERRAANNSTWDKTPYDPEPKPIDPETEGDAIDQQGKRTMLMSD